MKLCVFPSLPHTKTRELGKMFGFFHALFISANSLHKTEIVFNTNRHFFLKFFFFKF